MSLRTRQLAPIAVWIVSVVGTAGCRGTGTQDCAKQQSSSVQGIYSPGEALQSECSFKPIPAAAAAKFYSKSYTFSTDWFTPNISVWDRVLEPFKGRPDVHYLEVGVFEGRSAIWMLENVLTHPTARLTGIDIFPGNLREKYDSNLELSGSADKTTTIVGFSREALRALPPNSYDIIYIDGSHVADDVLTDVVLSWDLLKTGGILILDDYLLRRATHYPEELRPRVAIDAFVTAYRNSVEVVHRCYQAVLKKKANPCAPDKNNCSPIGGYVYNWRSRTLSSQAKKEQIALSDAERDVLEEIIKSRRFGETEYVVDEKLASNPDVATLKAKLKLEL